MFVTGVQTCALPIYPELIHERYGRDVELVIDGGVGDTVPTTVVDLTGGEPEILREGKGVLRE